MKKLKNTLSFSKDIMERLFKHKDFSNDFQLQKQKQLKECKCQSFIESVIQSVNNAIFLSDLLVSFIIANRIKWNLDY